MDNLFIKGNHNICEDYSLTFKHNNKSVLVVSDGCSSSLDTDIGSRVLCYAAKQAMVRDRRLSSHIENWNTLLFCDNLGFQTIQNARIITGVDFCLNDSCLDATLLIAIWDHNLNKGKAICFGDGVVIWKTKEYDNLNHIILNYESNAPYYLSYSLDKQREEDYKNAFGNDKLIVTSSYDRELNQNYYPYSKDLEIDFDESTTMIGLASDGLMSFEKDKTPVALNSIINPFFDFKNTNGEYLKRRVDKYLKQLHKEGYSHYDDISLATLLIKD